MSRGQTVPPTKAVAAALDEAARRAANASGDDGSISVDLMRDALLRNPTSSASRALGACGSSWRPTALALSSLEVTRGPSNSFQVFRLELGTATTDAFDTDLPVTTGAYLHAILEASPTTAEEIGVTPEAYLECLEAVLEREREL